MKMTRRELYGLMAGVAWTTELRAQPSAPFRYLADAANQIKAIEYGKAVLNGEDEARIFRLRCDALTRLIEDRQFRAALEDILDPRRLQSLQSPAFNLVESLAEFNSTFLPAELQLMRDFGLDYPMIFEGLNIASRERARTDLRRISAVSVMQSIDLGRSSACAMAGRAVAERERRAAHWTFGGITLVVADVAGALALGAVSGATLAVAAGAVIVSSIGIGATAAYNGAKGDVP